MYAPLYDDDHRALSVSATGARGVQTIQKGLRERLFCGACEGRLGEWERIVAPVWRKLLVRAAGSTPDTSVTVPCPYAPLKLFVLSLFFRVAIAGHPNYGRIEFSEDVLGSLRTMLRTEMPGTVMDFPSCLVGPAGLEHALKTIGLGGAGIYHGVSLVRIDVSGLTWFFAVGEDVQFPVRAPLAVSHHGLTAVFTAQHEAEYLKKMSDAVNLA